MNNRQKQKRNRPKTQKSQSSTKHQIIKSNNETYQLGKVLGNGSYGKVYRALTKSTKEYVAVKESKIRHVETGIPATSLREISILNQLKHENIVEIRELIYESKRNTKSQPVLYLIMELCDDNLQNFITDFPGSIPLRKIKQIFYKIVKGVDYMHANRFLHRDLKPANILMKDEQVKIADFGLSREFNIPLRPYSIEIRKFWYSNVLFDRKFWLRFEDFISLWVRYEFGTIYLFYFKIN